jgi:NAD(P)-dependent dehydrogenase (short-subunit alcohol dehydrogenase family)
MRAQRLGTIANMGSIGGWRGTPGAGLYCATKAAIAIYTEALRAELAPFGIQTTCIEPGYFRTNFLESDGSHKVTAKNHIPELDVVTQPTKSRLAAYSHHQPGDPVKAAHLIVEALTQTGRCQGRTLPPRLALGRDAVQVIGAALDQSCEALDVWKELVSTTDCDDVRN